MPHLALAAAPSPRLRRYCLALLAGCVVLGAQAAPFHAQALHGVARVELQVDGVADEFARYGLRSGELARRVTARLAAHGLPVVDAGTARAAPDAAQLQVRLVTNRAPYAFYFYAVSLRLNRKIPLDAQGHSFTSSEVWSEARHGVLNPSDLQAVYGYVDTLVDAFLSAHGRDNAGRGHAAATARPLR